jgi:hypothetical protein
LWQYPDEDTESAYSLKTGLHEYKTKNKDGPIYSDKAEAPKE